MKNMKNMKKTIKIVSVLAVAALIPFTLFGKRVAGTEFANKKQLVIINKLDKPVIVDIISNKKNILGQTGILIEAKQTRKLFVEEVYWFDKVAKGFNPDKSGRVRMSAQLMDVLKHATPNQIKFFIADDEVPVFVDLDPNFANYEVTLKIERKKTGTTTGAAGEVTILDDVPVASIREFMAKRAPQKDPTTFSTAIAVEPEVSTNM